MSAPMLQCASQPREIDIPLQHAASEGKLTFGAMLWEPRFGNIVFAAEDKINDSEGAYEEYILVRLAGPLPSSLPADVLCLPQIRDEEFMVERVCVTSNFLLIESLTGAHFLPVEDLHYEPRHEVPCSLIEFVGFTLEHDYLCVAVGDANSRPAILWRICHAERTDRWACFSVTPLKRGAGECRFLGNAVRDKEGYRVMFLYPSNEQNAGGTAVIQDRNSIYEVLLPSFSPFDDGEFRVPDIPGELGFDRRARMLRSAAPAVVRERGWLVDGHHQVAVRCGEGSSLLACVSYRRTDGQIGSSVVRMHRTPEASAPDAANTTAPCLAEIDITSMMPPALSNQYVEAGCWGAPGVLYTLCATAQSSTPRRYFILPIYVTPISMSDVRRYGLEFTPAFRAAVRVLASMRIMKPQQELLSVFGWASLPEEIFELVLESLWLSQGHWVS